MPCFISPGTYADGVAGKVADEVFYKRGIARPAAGRKPAMAWTIAGQSKPATQTRTPALAERPGDVSILDTGWTL